MAILCDHCDNWIHIKSNNLDKLDYEMLKSTADPWFCIICISNILPFCNRHEKPKETITTPTNLVHHNELFHLIKNLNLTYESSNDGTNSLIVSNKYRGLEYFCNLPGNIKSIFHHKVCSLSKNFDQLHALLTKLEVGYRFINFIILLRATYIRPSWDNCQRLPRRLLKQIQRFVRLLHQKDCPCTAEVNDVFKLLSR